MAHKLERELEYWLIAQEAVDNAPDGDDPKRVYAKSVVADLISAKIEQRNNALEKYYNRGKSKVAE